MTNAAEKELRELGKQKNVMVTIRGDKKEEHVKTVQYGTKNTVYTKAVYYAEGDTLHVTQFQTDGDLKRRAQESVEAVLTYLRGIADEQGIQNVVFYQCDENDHSFQCEYSNQFEERGMMMGFSTEDTYRTPKWVWRFGDGATDRYEKTLAAMKNELQAASGANPAFSFEAVNGSRQEYTYYFKGTRGKIFLYFSNRKTVCQEGLLGTRDDLQPEDIGPLVKEIMGLAAKQGEETANTNKPRVYFEKAMRSAMRHCFPQKQFANIMDGVYEHMVTSIRPLEIDERSAREQADARLWNGTVCILSFLDCHFVITESAVDSFRTRQDAERGFVSRCLAETEVEVADLLRDERE